MLDERPTKAWLLFMNNCLSSEVYLLDFFKLKIKMHYCLMSLFFFKDLLAYN